MAVRWLLIAMIALMGAGAAPARGGTVHVRIETDMGAITLALDGARAPATTANFLAYVDDARFDGTSFYRAARRKSDPRFGFVQGGIKTDARRILPPFPLETTDITGLRHIDGAISMARHDDPKSAGGNYFICVGAIPTLDASASSKGYAVFGRVIAGMPVVRRILSAPTVGQMLAPPVKVIRVVRLDGAANPTGRPRQWLARLPR